MNDLVKISNDLILFSMDEFGYFKLPDELSTGSSIMPQKKNPDVLELVRAKSSKVDSNLFLIKSITTKLQSGYNRDLQLTKEPLMESFEIALSTLKVFKIIIKGMEIDTKKCIEACTQELFATEQAYELVKKGVPFREAYQKVSNNLKNVPKINPVNNIVSKKHLGATRNLGLYKLKSKINTLNAELSSEIKKFNSKLDSLLKN